MPSILQQEQETHCEYIMIYISGQNSLLDVCLVP